MIHKNNQTIYECCKRGEDVNQTPFVIGYADTQREAIEYLENNGGGIYRNALHRFRIYINPKVKSN
jgi:hypothetical protein